MGMLDDVKSKKKQKAADNWMKMAASAKSVEKQIEYYTRSLDIDPYNAEAWFKKGKALESLGIFEKAKKCFDLAVEINPDYQGFIGNKYQPAAAPEVHDSGDADESDIIPMSSENSVFPEMEDEPGPSPAGDTIQDQRSDYSFTAPQGDESAFGSLLAEDDDEVSVPAEESDDVLQNEYSSRSSLPASDAVPDEEPASDNETDNLFDDSVPVFAAVSSGIENKAASLPAEDSPESFSSKDNDMSGSVLSGETTGNQQTQETAYPKGAEAESVRKTDAYSKEKLPSKAVVSEAVIRPAAAINSGGEPVDVRIPLSEAIKFWAIGIIAMLIVSVISSLIQG